MDGRTASSAEYYNKRLLPVGIHIHRLVHFSCYSLLNKQKKKKKKDKMYNIIYNKTPFLVCGQNNVVRRWNFWIYNDLKFTWTGWNFLVVVYLIANDNNSPSSKFKFCFNKKGEKTRFRPNIEQHWYSFELERESGGEEEQKWLLLNSILCLTLSSVGSAGSDE